MSTALLPPGYMDSDLHAHDIDKPAVVAAIRRIRCKVDDFLHCIFNYIHINDFEILQLDIIEKRYPGTSLLLHHVLGLSEDGPGWTGPKGLTIPNTQQICGLGLKNLLRSLIGIAIYDWVFNTPFPKAITSPDDSLKLIDQILTRYGELCSLHACDSYKLLILI